MNMTRKELKEWRKAHGYSQGKLAKALGVISLSVSRWETGERKIPSFLHLALKGLESEGGEPLEGRRTSLKPRKKGR